MEPNGTKERLIKKTRRNQRNRKKSQSYHKQQIDDMPSGFSIRLFIAISILLVVLLMKKYNISLGHFTADHFYQYIYLETDFNEIKEKLISLKAIIE